MIGLPILATLLLLAAAPAPFGAALAGPAEAEQIAREVEAALDQLGGDSFKVERRGAVRVSEEPDGRFLARLPPFALIDHQGGQARLEGAMLRVKRLDPRQRQIELTLPSRIPVIDGKGKEAYRLEPGRQRFAALWLPAVNNRLDRVDAAYSGLRLFQTGLVPPVAAGDLTVKSSEGGSAQVAFKLAVDPLPPADPGAPATPAALDGRGVLGPAPASPFGTAGRLDIVAGGLDALVGNLARQRRDPAVINAFATATILRTLGKPRTLGEGRKVHDYRLELGPDGQFLLNGLDLTALSQLLKRP
jgi:hypothetical protein